MSVHALSWVLRNSDERLGARLVLIVLADHARDDGSGAWPSIATIAEQARLSESGVKTSLRALEASGAIREEGRSVTGSHVYTVVMGGQNLTQGGPEAGPELKPLLQTTQVGSHTEDGSGPESDPPRSVAGRTVAPYEQHYAEAILRLWNANAEQHLTARTWLAKIIMRLREHPELSVADHGQIIRATLADPWWKGAASPSVVYGNAAQFERAMVAAEHGSPAERAVVIAQRAIDEERARRSS